MRDSESGVVPLTFARLAQRAARGMGSTRLLTGSLAMLVLWAVAGTLTGWPPAAHDWPIDILTWATWFACILIQATQTNQEQAMQTKLDAIILGLDRVSNRFVGLEDQEQTVADTAKQEVRTRGSARPTGQDEGT